MKSIQIDIYKIWMAVLAIGGFYLGLHVTQILPSDGHSICFFKNVSGLPCPGCGTTRAMLALFSGNVAQSLLINPLALIAMLAFIGTAVCFIIDQIKGTRYLEQGWAKYSLTMKQPIALATVLIAIALNWAWNISKGL